MVCYNHGPLPDQLIEVMTMTPSTFLPGTHIEIVAPPTPRGHVRSALFDFDGTLSLIRQGWQGVMIPLMVEILRETTPTAEDDEALTQIVTDYVTVSTGKQTIYQMMQLAEEVGKRGGEPLDPREYKALYLARLWAHICDRVSDLKEGRRDAADLLVPGAREVLENLRARGIACYLASGTDRTYVLDEAEALDLAQFFEGRIYGALEDYANYSKRMIIAQILRENNLAGPELVTFGDGFVEIEDTVAAGGIAVGVATDEVARVGIDTWKRDRLIQAGAAVIIPDFREHAALLSYLCNAES
jgi:phosphoglycolate phosphatase-like HAD superfamily hydrolase